MKQIASRWVLTLAAVGLLSHCQSSAPDKTAAKRDPVILAVFAHPDDEATVSAVLAKYAAEGAQVHLAVATDGRLGVSSHAGIPAGDALAEARTRELACAAEKLGIHAPIRFGLHDQLRMAEGLAVYGAQIREVRDRVTRLFEELQPDVVITWGPSGWTGHPDHRVVSSVVTEVFQSKAWDRPSQLYYPAIPTGRAQVPNPIEMATVDERFLTVRIPLDQALYDKAKESWLCHRSQYTPEQIEQLHASLIGAQAGTAYFQPAVAVRGKVDSLLGSRIRQ